MDTLSLYIILPDNDEDFVLLGDGISAYMDIPKQLLEIKKLFSHKTSYTLFYSGNNIECFCSKANTICGGSYLEQIESQIRHLIGNNSRNVDVTVKPKVNHFLYRWDLNNPTNNTYENSNLIISAVETYCNFTKEVAMVSFKESEWDRDILPIIEDSKQESGLPLISNIPYFYPYSTFIEWYKERSSDRTFSLLDVSVFERTSYIYPKTKRRIYKKTSTGEYWYYDFFHKDNKEHFEVFNTTGQHVGEANINGEIDVTKKDAKKSINRLLFGHQ